MKNTVFSCIKWESGLLFYSFCVFSAVWMLRLVRVWSQLSSCALRSFCPGVLRALSEYYQTEARDCVHVWLSADTDHFCSSAGDTGWGCGYRNIQMLLSSLHTIDAYAPLLQGAHSLCSISDQTSELLCFTSHDVVNVPCRRKSSWTYKGRLPVWVWQDRNGLNLRQQVNGVGFAHHILLKEKRISNVARFKQMADQCSSAIYCEGAVYWVLTCYIYIMITLTFVRNTGVSIVM